MARRADRDRRRRGSLGVGTPGPATVAGVLVGTMAGTVGEASPGLCSEFRAVAAILTCAAAPMIAGSCGNGRAAAGATASDDGGTAVSVGISGAVSVGISETAA